MGDLNIVNDWANTTVNGNITDMCLVTTMECSGRYFKYYGHEFHFMYNLINKTFTDLSTHESMTKCKFRTNSHGNYGNTMSLI